MIEPIQTIALPNSMDALAIGVGAISGALHARRRHMDVMGILVVAFCAALGGGVIRDILLASGPPVFLTSSVFLIYAFVGATIGWLFSRYASRATMLMEVIDGLFIGVWVLVGATKALSNGLGFGSAILVAVIIPLIYNFAGNPAIMGPNAGMWQNLITFVVVILVLYLVNLLPLDGRAKQIARVVVIVIGVVSLLRYLAVF